MLLFDVWRMSWPVNVGRKSTRESRLMSKTTKDRPNSGGVKSVSRSPESPGNIDPGQLYRADEALARAGWKYSAFTEAKRRGLKTFKSGRRLYVRGEDLIEFITSDVEGVAE